MKILSKPEYLEALASTRDERMAWWREARFGLFIHFGLYAQLGRGEWVMAFEGWSVKEYEALADSFTVKPDAAREWVRLAKAGGMKYVVLTTRHHDGFSLWDSRVNPYNSVNYGPKRDIVGEFVDACRIEGVRIGFYSSLMDWRHPDGGRAAYDGEARGRFQKYLYALNEELLTQYGPIDVLWYDAAFPMEHEDGWNSLEYNQRLRALQPHIIINNRSVLPEDFGTPEGHITTGHTYDRDWEACMTFNNISWGYVDSEQAAPYSYNTQRIVQMLSTATAGGGNLLLNIGPAPDGSVPPEAVEPLHTVGRWLAVNGECVYGKVQRNTYHVCNGVCMVSVKGTTVYVWNGIWPQDGQMLLGGFRSPLASARILNSGAAVAFEQRGCRILLKGLPKRSPDPIIGVTVLALEFSEVPVFIPFFACPPINQGREYQPPD